ncbi:MAG: DNA-damage-inducible protein J [Candidatus Omnitrophota bacterium]|jgi:DNA-damage-inducible protein J
MEAYMIKKARVEARVDLKLKDEVGAVLKKLDISESEAIRIYFRQIALTKSIPFEIKVPNKETLAALNEIKDAQLREFKNFDSYLSNIGIK